MNRSVVNVEDLTAGQVIYAAPGALIVPDVLTSQTLNKQQKDKHPLLILSVNRGAQQITVTYIASFSKASNLASVGIPDSAKKLFVPITPAVREFDHNPIAWASHPSPEPCWVSVRSKIVLTGAAFTTFDNAKYFTAETAASLDSMINTIVQ